MRERIEKIPVTSSFLADQVSEKCALLSSLNNCSLQLVLQGSKTVPSNGLHFWLRTKYSSSDLPPLQQNVVPY